MLQEYIMAVVSALVVLHAVWVTAYLYRKPRRRARVDITQVYLSAGGSMIDVRYRVRQPGRVLASPENIFVLGPDGTPAGRIMNVARIGKLATRRADRKTGGYLLFRNTGQIERGDPVTVVIGNARREAILVQ